MFVHTLSRSVLGYLPCTLVVASVSCGPAEVLASPGRFGAIGLFIMKRVRYPLCHGSGASSVCEEFEVSGFLWTPR